MPCADGCSVDRNRVLKLAYITLPIYSSSPFSMLSSALMTSERILYPRIPCLCNFWLWTQSGFKRKALPIMQFWLTQLCWAVTLSDGFFCPFFNLLFLTCDSLDLQTWNGPTKEMIPIYLLYKTFELVYCIKIFKNIWRMWLYMPFCNLNIQSIWSDLIYLTWPVATEMHWRCSL